MYHSNKHKILQLYLKATKFLDKEDWFEVFKITDEITELDPQDAFSHEIRGAALKRAGYLEEAIESLSKAILLKPYKAQLYISIGACKTMLVQELNDDEKKKKLISSACLDYEKAMNLDPSNISSILSISEIEICTGNYSTAINTLNYILDKRLSPQNKLVCNWMMSITMLFNNKKEKENNWKQYADCFYKNVKTIKKTGWCPVEIGMHIESILEEKKLNKEEKEEITKLLSTYIKNNPTGNDCRNCLSFPRKLKKYLQ